MSSSTESFISNINVTKIVERSLLTSRTNKTSKTIGEYFNENPSVLYIGILLFLILIALIVKCKLNDEIKEVKRQQRTHKLMHRR